MEDERALRRELDALAKKREQLDASRTLRWKDECLFARFDGWLTLADRVRLAM